ncbi:sel1 repeat family protein [Paracoccaceae bacterium]|nr:sel1 repeat family protein [Paracoccaceae bacterium]
MLSFMAFTPVAAQDWTKGVDAYNAGDYATALQEWRPLAEAGDAQAQYSLALMYDLGRGVPRDYAEASKWYRLAAEQGKAQAQYNLGFSYATGLGVLQDNVIAHMWWNLAAANGHEKAGERRDKIANKMSPAAIEKAQAMARECMSSGYTKCGD